MHNPKDCSDCSEDWGWFVGDVTASVRPLGFEVTGMTHGDRCVPLGPDARRPETSLDVATRQRAGELEDGEWVGYILLDPKGRLAVLQHDMPDGILREASQFFGFEIPLRNAP